MVSGNNLEIQRIHYDRQAQNISPKAIPWEFDENNNRRYLQAPYEFCARWFSRRDLLGRNILDFGCGARCLSLYFLANRGANLFGIDISPRSINVAQNRASHLGFRESYSFLVGNGETLPCRDDTFEYLLSAGTLSCLSLKVAAKEIHRVLKPEGYAVIIDTLGNNPILNFNRHLKLWQGRKTSWSVTHVLTEETVREIAGPFSEVSLHFFDLMSLLWAPFSFLMPSYPNQPIRVLQKLDHQLLSHPSLQKYAFKVVCILRKAK